VGSGGLQVGRETSADAIAYGDPDPATDSYSHAASHTNSNSCAYANPATGVRAWDKD
jgi:hypothetical protein